MGAQRGADAAQANEPGRTPATYVVVGGGWRASFFLRLTRSFPDRFAVSAIVTRTAEHGERLEAEWGIAHFPGLAHALAAHRPDFVVAAVPWAISPIVVREAVALDVPILTETPPAPDLAGLIALWTDVGQSGLVQVAEQYPRYPGHAARLELIREGVIGDVSNVQVSSTHGYHAIALIRAMLGVGFEPAAITAHTSAFSLTDPISRSGWTHDLEPQQATNVTAYLDFGGGRTALYDFTDNQWHNPLRSRRVVVRGSLGEIANDHVIHLRDETTIVDSDLVRRQTGIDLNLEGFDLDHITFEGRPVYRNAWLGGRLSDDEIAVASMLDGMAAWVRDGKAPPYPLGEGCQDHMLALAIDDSLRTGATVTTARNPWAP